MKKIFLIAIAAIAFISATQAQDSAVAKRKMDMDRSGKMQHAPMDELNLTPDQKDKVKKIREDNMTKMNDIKNNSSLNDDQKQEKIKALRMEQRTSMEAVLTDEQKAKMKQMREERMKEHKEMKAGSDSTMR